MNRIICTVEPDGERGVQLDGERLDPQESLKIVNHSPDGFSWGYSGSGPSQLALAILYRLCRRMFTDVMNDKLFFDLTQFEVGDRRQRDIHIKLMACKFYQDFKRQFVAGWPIDETVVVEIDIIEWLGAKLADLHQKEVGL